MTPSGPSRRRVLLPMALVVAWLVPGSHSPAQATKPLSPPAKEQAKPGAGVKEHVDLNSATAEELMTLPGIGEASSRKIIDTRPHKAVSDLARHGVPEKTIEGLKGLAVVHPLHAPIEINSATVEQLETLPGVGPALSKEIVAGRPFADYEGLAKLKGLGPAKIDGLKGRLKFDPHADATSKAKKAEMPAAKESKPAVFRRTGPIGTSGAAATEAPASRININKASKEELDALPGIGPVKAQAILDARPFATIEDVMKVKGIKEGEFAKIKDRITVK